MSGPSDNRLLDSPLVPVTCRRCAAEAFARKSSWAQTTVQWTAAAMAACVRRREALALAGRDHQVFLSCSDLRSAIDDAVRCGDLPILDDECAGW